MSASDVDSGILAKYRFYGRVSEAGIDYLLAFTLLLTSKSAPSWKEMGQSRVTFYVKSTIWLSSRVESQSTVQPNVIPKILVYYLHFPNPIEAMVPSSYVFSLKLLGNSPTTSRPS